LTSKTTLLVCGIIHNHLLYVKPAIFEKINEKNSSNLSPWQIG